MKKHFWPVVWVIALEIVVVLLLVPGEFTQQAIDKESNYIERSLGSDSRKWITTTADEWYDRWMIQSGAYEAIHHHMIPTEKERERSRGLQQAGKGWFGWIEGRIEALGKVVYQMCMRLALVMLWAPYMLLLLIPAVYDGTMSRMISRTNFNYTSPVLHRYSVRGLMFVFGTMITLMLLPIAVDPVIIPVALMFACVLTGVAVGNLQKRI